MEKEADMAMKIATFRFGVIGDFVTGTKFGYGDKERLLAEMKRVLSEAPTQRPVLVDS